MYTMWDAVGPQKMDIDFNPWGGVSEKDSKQSVDCMQSLELHPESYVVLRELWYTEENARNLAGGKKR